MIDLAGGSLAMLLGQGAPRPAPPYVADAFEGAEIALSEDDLSGFSLTFRVASDGLIPGPAPILADPSLHPGARVVLSGLLGVTPTVLMDGIIETRRYTPEDGASPAMLTVLGRDLTFLMDKDHKTAAYPNMSHKMIADLILLPYASHGVVPQVIPPLASNAPAATDFIPHQNTSDFKYLRNLARLNGYVFALTSGPLPGVSTAYWGPRQFLSVPQPAITVNMGSSDNARNLKITHAAAKAKQVSGAVIEPTLGAAVEVRSVLPLRPPLSISPSIVNPTTTGTQVLAVEAGIDVATAFARAQSQSDNTSLTVRVTGELDTLSYSGVLKPMQLVGLRGAGPIHSGLYYVSRTVHKISPGSWTQEFALARDGEMANTPVVRP